MDKEIMNVGNFDEILEFKRFEKEEETIGKYRIIKSYTNGLYVGKIKSIKYSVYLLTNARKIWFFKGRTTLEEVGAKGLTYPKRHRISEIIPEIEVPYVLDTFYVSEKAKKTIDLVPFMSKE